MQEIDRHADLEKIMQQEIVMLFKHSAACPVSWAAHAHVARFRVQNPAVPVYVIPVLKERAITRLISERTRVRHESPQVILLRRGAVVSVASHEAISARHLCGMLGPAAPVPGDPEHRLSLQ